MYKLIIILELLSALLHTLNHLKEGKGHKFLTKHQVQNRTYIFQKVLCKIAVEFEVFTAVVMKSIIFWDVTPCSLLSCNRRFGGTYRLHIHGRRNNFRRTSKQSSKLLLCNANNSTVCFYFMTPHVAMCSKVSNFHDMINTYD
jgi:hypothetical protein